jgi:hypothetical protein
MLDRSSIAAVLLALPLLMPIARAQAFDDAKYPDWKGQWVRIGAANFDPSKPPGQAQQAPLTKEYQAILDASVADQAAGGQGNNPMARCIPPGMPRMMIGYGGIEFIMTETITIMVFADPMRQYRRIFTDGRAWPEKIMPTYSGYSIGRWEDGDGDGRLDTLVVETRGLRGPRVYENSGIPLHANNQSVIKERIYLDKANPSLLYDEVTVIDRALTRPWSVKRTFGRQRTPVWFEAICGEDDHQVRIGTEDYYISADGLLMPTRKDQASPELRFFSQPQK